MDDGKSVIVTMRSGNEYCQRQMQNVLIIFAPCQQLGWINALGIRYGKE